MPPQIPPARITCHPAYLEAAQPIPDEFLRDLFTKASQYFHAASSGAIELLFSGQPIPRLQFPPAPTDPTTVTAARLHTALRLVAPNSSRPVKRIGLIFARAYHFFPDDVLGIMFDRGFVTQDDPASSFTSIAREGCAVFVDAIIKARTVSGNPSLSAQQIREEIAFTTIHELGHVFNLGHLGHPQGAPANFMTPSSDRPHGPQAGSAFRFTPNQALLLSQCARDDYPFIRPGGSRYGDLGSEFDQSFGGEYDIPHNLAFRPDPRLHLKIDIATAEFSPHRPVELDIEISLAKGRKQPVKIPNRVDCGYSDFNIWIEEPDGETRRYRPINHYCSLEGEKISIQQGKPFARDVSIFGQSGGYTFRKPGIHRIRAALRTGAKTQIVSNILEVDIASMDRLKSSDRNHWNLVKQAGPALFYRSGVVPVTASSALITLAEKPAKKGMGMDRAAACYSLGRRYAEAPAGDSRLKTAKEMLRRAADCEELGHNRVRIASQLVEELSSK
jgi:hypothetical protein